MSDHEYQIALTIFFVSYVAVEIPSNLALKILRPQYWITINMVLWSICTIALGLVKTGPQLIAVRFLLGLFEGETTVQKDQGNLARKLTYIHTGGLFPGLNFIFSLYYTREQLGQRVAIFFAGATRELRYASSSASCCPFSR